ncbi:hypothetical protein KRMM14A1004_38100 [Krasilnikovia sp. MM14-A1004]
MRRITPLWGRGFPFGVLSRAGSAAGNAACVDGGCGMRLGSLTADVTRPGGAPAAGPTLRDTAAMTPFGFAEC